MHLHIFLSDITGSKVFQFQLFYGFYVYLSYNLYKVYYMVVNKLKTVPHCALSITLPGSLSLSHSLHPLSLSFFFHSFAARTIKSFVFISFRMFRIAVVVVVAVVGVGMGPFHFQALTTPQKRQLATSN